MPQSGGRFPRVQRFPNSRMLDFIEREAYEDERTRRVAESRGEGKQGTKRQFRSLGLLLIGQKIEFLQHPSREKGRHGAGGFSNEIPDCQVGALLALARQVFVEINNVGIDGRRDDGCASPGGSKQWRDNPNQKIVSGSDEKERTKPKGRRPHANKPESFLPKLP